MSPTRIVCGYRGTGKDSLYKQFNHNQPWGWLVLADPNITTPFIVESITRIGLADQLKKDVLQQLDLPLDFDIDAHKDTLVIQGKLLRSHFIDHGADMRNVDQNYWCIQAFDRRNLSYPHMVTDWRFPNELRYVEALLASQRMQPPTTIRVFRKKVPIPAANIESEHSLDAVMTNFVLISNIEDYSALLERFPQYRNHKFVQPFFC